MILTITKVMRMWLQMNWQEKIPRYPPPVLSIFEHVVQDNKNKNTYFLNLNLFSYLGGKPLFKV